MFPIHHHLSLTNEHVSLIVYNKFLIVNKQISIVYNHPRFLYKTIYTSHFWLLLPPHTSFKTDPGATKPSETLELREGKPVRSSKVKGSSSCEFSTMEEWRKSRNRPTEIGKRQFGDIPGIFLKNVKQFFSVKRWIPF